MFLASDVYKAVRALLNDKVGSLYTDAVQQEYLNIALADLRIRCEAYNIPVTNETVAEIDIPAGTTEIVFNAVAPAPSLPPDLVEPNQLFQRWQGNTTDYIPMTKVRFIPPWQVATNTLIYWAWIGQKIALSPCNADSQIRIDYTKHILAKVVDKDQPIDVINTQSFLQYRTAALCASYVGENESRAKELNITAQMELDHFLAIGIKGGQSIATRRRPFNQSYKSWTGWYL